MNERVLAALTIALAAFCSAGCGPVDETAAPDQRTSDPITGAFDLDAPHQADDPVDGIRWLPNLDSALAASSADGRPVLIVSSARKLGLTDTPHY